MSSLKKHNPSLTTCVFCGGVHVCMCVCMKTAIQYTINIHTVVSVECSANTTTMPLICQLFYYHPILCVCVYIVAHHSASPSYVYIPTCMHGHVVTSCIPLMDQVCVCVSLCVSKYLAVNCGGLAATVLPATVQYCGCTHTLGT